MALHETIYILRHHQDADWESVNSIIVIFCGKTMNDCTVTVIR